MVAARQGRAGMPADGEFAFTELDFTVIVQTLYDEAGIHLPATKAAQVHSRVAKRLRALGLESFHDYCTLIGRRDGAEERAAMIAALTTNVTRFFREPIISPISRTGSCRRCCTGQGRVSSCASGRPAARAARNPIPSPSPSCR